MNREDLKKIEEIEQLLGDPVEVKEDPDQTLAAWHSNCNELGKLCSGLPAVDYRKIKRCIKMVSENVIAIKDSFLNKYANIIKDDIIYENGKYYFDKSQYETLRKKLCFLPSIKILQWRR